MTTKELLLDCLRLGLDDEKVDYDWKQEGDSRLILTFEDGHEVRVVLEDLS
jgi:hypothetical protein